ncbi:MAG: saccharopine dehydrogenase NADP-binding domain-containing protein [Pseudomonadota bacterium]
MTGNAQENSREFDIIVWGATGFTGQLVAEHLADTYGIAGELRWAIAGRNPDKLEALREQLARGRRKPPMVLADSQDTESLKALAQRTRVVATTVGPYSRLGSELVAECARNGTHYCDLAGELPWIRRMMDAHGGTAKRSGAVIVHCCGFDSIPSDVGVWFLQREAQARFEQPLQRVHGYVERMSGGFSGGTAASMLEVAKEARSDRRTARLLTDPYALNPRNASQGADENESLGFRRDEFIDGWVAPFLMASINTRIVRRTNALMGDAYGRDFRYAEYTATGGGAMGLAKAAAMSGALASLLAGAVTAPGRAFLSRFVFPDQGDGPNAEARENGHYRIRFAGVDEDGRTLQATVTGDRDPGYGSTSRMLGEAAVCLARSAPRGPGERGGFSTPAAAMGDALIERLQRNAGVTFEVDEAASSAAEA